MADKIYNLNDYKKNDDTNKNYKTNYQQCKPIDADDIQIEDPLNFLSSKEKEEYIKAHSNTIFNPNAIKEVNDYLDNEAKEENLSSRQSKKFRDNQMSRNYNKNYDKDYDNEDSYDSYDDGYDDNYDGDDFNENFDEESFDNNDDDYDNYENDDFNDNYQLDDDLEEYSEENDEYRKDELLVKVTKLLAFITSVIVLILIIFTLKNKFFDTVDNATSDDTSSTYSSASVEGTNVVTTSDLNLRTTPEKSDNVALTVQSGTSLIYVGDENGWAKVYYNGNYYYCSKSYITAQ